MASSTQDHRRCRRARRTATAPSPGACMCTIVYDYYIIDGAEQTRTTTTYNSFDASTLPQAEQQCREHPRPACWHCRTRSGECWQSWASSQWSPGPSCLLCVTARRRSASPRCCAWPSSAQHSVGRLTAHRVTFRLRGGALCAFIVIRSTRWLTIKVNVQTICTPTLADLLSDELQRRY